MGTLPEIVVPTTGAEAPGFPERENLGRPESRDRVVIRRPEELRPHPSYTRLGINVAAAKLSSLLMDEESAFRQPLVVTTTGIILDGHARWALARMKSREALPCLELDQDENEALISILQRHRRSTGLNDFVRIMMALDLEPCLQKRARENQRIAARNKASSNLTEAERVDVRAEIASVAGVSVGNVSKVKSFIGTLHKDIRRALQGGEVSIHWAWKHRTGSLDQQREALWKYQGQKGIVRTIKKLISRHKPAKPRPEPELETLIQRLNLLDKMKIGPVAIGIIDTPGKALFLTQELFWELTPEEEPKCASNSR